MRRAIALAFVMLAAGATFAAPCGSTTAAQCATWCGVENGSSCDSTVTSYCIYHNRSWIECGYVRAVITCTCIYDTGPHLGYEDPTLSGHGFLVECDNGVGVDEETGDAYCLPPESEP